MEPSSPALPVQRPPADALLAEVERGGSDILGHGAVARAETQQDVGVYRFLHLDPLFAQGGLHALVELVLLGHSALALAAQLTQSVGHSPCLGVAQPGGAGGGALLGARTGRLETDDLAQPPDLLIAAVDRLPQARQANRDLRRRTDADDGVVRPGGADARGTDPTRGQHLAAVPPRSPPALCTVIRPPARNEPLKV